MIGHAPEGQARRELVDRMAAYLRRREVTTSEADAIRALTSGPFRMGDVAALADDALIEARRPQ